MGGRIYLVNVGSNARHPFCSPLFPDGRFEFLPIPEQPNLSGPHAVRYGDLRSFYDPDGSLTAYLPERWLSVAAHNDPEFETFTYGDNCEANPRASSLRRVRPMDYLFFIASLCVWKDGKASHRHGFYLVGFLEVEEVLANVLTQPDKELVRQYGNNAHILRGATDAQLWDGFWVFQGSLKSQRFNRAVPVTRKVTERLFTSADGSPWQWGNKRSEMQTIGSYTRTCRCVLDPVRIGHDQRIRLLWDWVDRHQDASEWMA